MSNVLIGIIGVILFIGLALAGALFLGPRFQQSAASADAAAMMAAIKQVADAGDMWRLQEGRTYLPATSSSFLTPGYLKITPGNPTPSGRQAATYTPYYWSIHFDNNIHVYDRAEPQYAAKYVIGVVGEKSDSRSKEICEAISRTYGTTPMPDLSFSSDPHPTAAAGCFLAYSLTSTDAEPTAAYVAYQRIAPTAQSITQPSGF